MKKLADHYLPFALTAGFICSNGWALFQLLLGEPNGDQAAIVLSAGMMIWLIAPFMLVVFVSGLIAGFRRISPDKLEIDVLADPKQRSRFGFILMAASMAAFVTMGISMQVVTLIASGAALVTVAGAFLALSCHYAE